MSRVRQKKKTCANVRLEDDISKNEDKSQVVTAWNIPFGGQAIPVNDERIRSRTLPSQKPPSLQSNQLSVN